jgi:hypothetical protein
VAPPERGPVVVPEPAVVAEPRASELVQNHNGLTLNGVVGLPLNPTANVPNKGGLRIQGDYFDLGSIVLDNNFRNSPLGVQFDRNQEIGDTKFYGLHAAYGLTKRLEINGGIEHLRARGRFLSAVDSDDFSFDDNDGTHAAIGLKYQVFRSQTGDSAVAIGAGYSRALFRNYNAYLVGTKSFGVGRRAILGHLGVRYDRFRLQTEDEINGGTTFDFSDTSHKVSIYGGVEVPIDSRGRFAFIGEIGSKNASSFDLGDFTFGPGFNGRVNTKFPYSASLRFANKGLSANVGIMRQGVTSDSGLFVQLGKTF